MKLKTLALATVLTLGSASAYAGNFVTLTSGVGGTLTTANGGIVNGANALTGDKLYIENLSTTTYLAGHEYGSDNTIASLLNYRTFTGSTTTGTGSLTLLDWSVTENFALVGSTPQGKVYDFVYRDNTDGKLVFGSRFINQTDNNQEINYMYRGGFTGQTVSSAWTFLSDFDLRQYSAARTDDHSFNGTVPFVENYVRQKADVSVTEGNPWSGLYLVKTNYTEYTTGANAIGLYQAGEEGQAVAGSFISGFIPTVAAVPETDTYAMLLAGLSIVSFVVRRKSI
jgi:hypothetical protein